MVRRSPRSVLAYLWMFCNAHMEHKVQCHIVELYVTVLVCCAGELEMSKKNKKSTKRAQHAFDVQSGCLLFSAFVTPSVAAQPWSRSCSLHVSSQTNRR